jgi:hippurate hydrolase
MPAATTATRPSCWRRRRRCGEARDFDGTLNLIFQPDEENLCGARAMIADGLFERFPCDAVYALHNAPGVPLGTALAVAGPVTLSSDVADVTIRGVGGHGAMPHRARDPVAAAAAIVTRIADGGGAQRGARRHGGGVGRLHPWRCHAQRDSAVGDAGPQRARGTARDARAGRAAHPRDRQLHGAGAWRGSRDRLSPAGAAGGQHSGRDAADGAGLRRAGRRRACLRQVPKGFAGSEDFAWMLAALPGCYLLLGNGEGEFGGCMVHNPGYDFNDQVLPLGAACWVRLAQTYLVA